MRILIVDDDQVIRLMQASLLKPYGDCTEAIDGVTAIRLFTAALVQRQPFGLVCLDIQMPGLDGHATLRCLRAIESGFGNTGMAGAKILMATVQNTARDVMTAFREQADGYVVKPIDPVQLRNQVEAVGLKPSHA